MKLTRRAALAGAAALPAVRAARAQAPQEVKIAMLVPLSGPWARQGILEQMGARLAVDDVNAAGGIKSMGGAKLKLVEYDTQDSAEKAKDGAQRMLAAEPDLVGGFGCWLSTFTLAATEVTERAELPWLTLSYSDLITGRGFKYVFQSSPTADRQATEELPMIMEIAEKATGKKPTKMAIVGDNTASSVSFMKPIREHIAKDLGVTIVTDEVYTPPLADATTMVQHVRSARPDFVIFQSTNVPDDKLLVDKFAEFNLRSDRLPKIGGGGHWAVPELLKNAGAENLEGVMVGLANWPGKDQADLEKRFMARTGEPWFGHDSIFAYVHVLILKEALEHAGVADRRKVAQAIRELDMTTGPADFFPDKTLKYDANGRRVGAKLCVVQWRGGKPVPVYPPSIATNEVMWPKT
ncbi:ABC transporter substrate-binding protein [Rhodopila sp.]|uniref:ABC transporter substrate-binding protein n=1 Tax=Rhodopila sp. TaxID=2480087 RepID=UPI002CC7F2D6|nr:ABC transporter substrate-binding protein [Rhodopila sp.]HVZ09363.1 ABC transporter substrate-binding protein [Rhodopila sp.]